jgi:hypothetical protein
MIKLQAVVGMVLLNLIAWASTDPSPVAFVETINGKANLITSGGSNRDLDPNSDLGLIFNSGDELKCPGGSSVMGLFVNENKPNQRPKPIELCNRKFQDFPTPTSEYRVPAEAARKLNEYARAGRSKGSETPIFDPPDNGAVLASKFLVEWRIRPPLDNFVALLQDGATELARVPKVDGGTGKLDDPSLRQAVLKLSESSAPNHKLRLTFRFEGGSEKTATFSVLNRDEEKRLTEALADVSEAGLFKFVERATIYDSFHLYGLVPAEYAAALSEAPQSRDLLRAALEAYSRIGDSHNARQINDKLKQIEETEKN